MCTEALNCVTLGFGGNKIIFGSGTKLYVNDSKLILFFIACRKSHCPVKCRKCSGVNRKMFKCSVKVEKLSFKAVHVNVNDKSQWGKSNFMCFTLCDYWN